MTRSGLLGARGFTMDAGHGPQEDVPPRVGGNITSRTVGLSSGVRERVARLFGTSFGRAALLYVVQSSRMRTEA